jgi:hypothetical protein
VSVRKRGEGDIGEQKVDQFAAALLEEIGNKRF